MVNKVAFLFLALFVSLVLADPDWRIEHPLERKVDDICQVSRYVSGIPSNWMWDGCSFREMAATQITTGAVELSNHPLGAAGRQFGEALDAAGSNAGLPAWAEPGDPVRPIHSMHGYKDTLFVGGMWEESSDWSYISAGTFAPKSGTALRGGTHHSLFQLPTADAKIEVMLPMWVSDEFGALDDDVKLEDTSAGDIVYLVAGSTGTGEDRTLFVGAPNVNGGINDFAPGGEFQVPGAEVALGRIYPMGAARYDMEGDPMGIKDQLESDGIKALAWIVGLTVEETNPFSHLWYTPVQVTVVVKDDGSFEILGYHYALGSGQHIKSATRIYKLREGEPPPTPPGFSYGNGYSTLADGDDFIMLSWFVPDSRRTVRTFGGSYGSFTGILDNEQPFEMINVLMRKSYEAGDGSALAVGSDAVLINPGRSDWQSACSGSLAGESVRCLLVPTDVDPSLVETTVLAEGRGDEWDVVYYPNGECRGCDLPTKEERTEHCSRTCVAHRNVWRKTWEEIGFKFFTFTVSRPALVSLGHVTTMCPTLFDCRIIGVGGYSIGDYYHGYEQITWVSSLDSWTWGGNGAKAGGGLFLLGGAGTYSYKRKSRRSLKRKKKPSVTNSKEPIAEKSSSNGAIVSTPVPELSPVYDETSKRRPTGSGASRGSRGPKSRTRRSNGSKRLRRSSGSKRRSSGSKRGSRTSRTSIGSTRSKSSHRSNPLVTSG